jgi:hypothetical protein
MKSNIDMGDVMKWKYQAFYNTHSNLHAPFAVLWKVVQTFREWWRPSSKRTRLSANIGHNPFEVEGIPQYTRLISLPQTPATASFRNGSSRQCLTHARTGERARARTHTHTYVVVIISSYRRRRRVTGTVPDVRSAAIHKVKLRSWCCCGQANIWEELTSSICVIVLLNKNWWYPNATLPATRYFCRRLHVNF